MPAKKNTTAQYISDMQKNNNVSEKIRGSFITIFTSLVIGAIFGGVGVVRLSDSTAIKVGVNAKDITELKDTTVSRNEFALIIDRLGRIEDNLIKLLEK